MWHPLETSDWFSGDLCDTCCFSDSLAAAILHHHRRNIPSLLVLQPPRSRIPFSYCLTACHQLGWFLFRRAEIISVLSPTANSSLRQLGQLSHCRDVMRGLPLTCGETPWSPDGTSHSTRQHSTQQQAQFAALHSLHSPAASHARASLRLLSSNFLTPERLYVFSSPATF